MFEKVAKNKISQKNLLFVKLNVEMNDLPFDLKQIKKFPKIYLYLKNYKMFPIKFKNKINIVELNKFCNLKRH